MFRATIRIWSAASSATGPLTARIWRGIPPTTARATQTTARSLAGPAAPSGKIGQGLSFGASDTDDKVSITSNFNGTGVVSVSAWMYPRGGGGGDFGRIITNEQLYVAVKGSDFSLLFSRDSGANACASLVSVWAANNWYHVVAVSPASGATVQWYINGSDATNEAGCGTPVSATSWNIGNNAGSSRSFNGLIDDVRIYNRA